jgi:hypothetical protein
MYDLPYIFNRMTCMDFLGEDRWAAFIIHYAGYHYFYGFENLKALLEKDLKVWSEKREFKRHIAIEVQGGLGDQLCAAPAIKYLLEKIYPEQDIIIRTHFPVLFRDFNCPVFTYEEKIDEKIDVADKFFFKLNTLPGPETINWSILSNLLCHTVDYCSSALLKMTLPIKDKSFFLNVKQEELDELNKLTNGRDLKNYVLIHGGRHWQSKSFPQEYWQKIVDELEKEKVPICLIGADEPTRGIYDLKLNSDTSIDLRNRTNLELFIAAISQGKILLSNDSAPIHIAGAFDNEIILIPTCKHPDHLLPFRNGQQHYKACALYKNLAVEDFDRKPTDTIGMGDYGKDKNIGSGEFLKKDWGYYLPEVSDVVTKIKEKLCQ